MTNINTYGIGVEGDPSSVAGGAADGEGAVDREVGEAGASVSGATVVVGRGVVTLPVVGAAVVTVTFSVGTVSNSLGGLTPSLKISVQEYRSSTKTLPISKP